MFILYADFFLRWSQNIHVRVRGLDKNYDRLYEGTFLEGKIEQVLLWAVRQSQVHHDLVSTGSVRYKGWCFGFIEYHTQKMATVDGPGSNTLLGELAEVSADDVEELDNEID